MASRVRGLGLKKRDRNHEAQLERNLLMEEMLRRYQPDILWV